MRQFVIVLASCLAGSAPAQIQTAELLRQQQGAQTPATAAWFVTGFDLVEAQLACDVAGAAATAKLLVAAARDSQLPGVGRVADALQRLAVAAGEGPTRAEADSEASTDAASVQPGAMRANEPLADGLRARLHSARARVAWLADRPTDFAASAFLALDAARAAKDAGLQLRAAWMLHIVVEHEAEAYDAELLREIQALRQAQPLPAFEPWHRLNDYWASRLLHTGDEGRRELDAIEALATAIGDVRTRVHVQLDRAGMEMEAEHIAAGDAAAASATQLATQLGDRRMLAVAIETAAEFALGRSDTEAAAALLRQAAATIAGRGLADREVHQAHLRLRLASRRDDAAATAAETKLLEDLRQQAAQRYRGYATMREQLLSGERRRLNSEQTQARAKATVRTVMLAGVLVVLAAIAGVTWVGRRRLQHAHRDLQREVARAESEAAARRELQQRLQAMERADSLGVIASGIAHDFNNLMTAVLGNAELLRTEDREGERARLLDTLVAAGQSGAQLCHQLQSFAIEQPTRLAGVDLTVLLHHFAPVLQAATGGSIPLHLDLCAEPLGLQGNATELEQATLNLVTNARDAKARSIRLRCSRETMPAVPWPAAHLHGEPRAGSFACIEVSDDGEGMGKDLLSRIFEPFFTTRFAGRGLGLAVVLGASRRHRGVISVQSQPGQGSCFRLYLPLQQEAVSMPGPTPVSMPAPTAAAVPVTASDSIAQSATPAATPPTTIAPMAVLIVDDEAPVREFIAMALRRRGHRAIVVAAGDQVEAALTELGPAPRAVALVDLTMPGIDGRDVVRIVRRNPHDLAVVMMSGHADEQLLNTARQLGADGWIAKPFTSGDLERELDLALRRRSTAQAAG